MRLMLAKEFRELFAEGSRPDKRTVRKWVREGAAAGVEIGRNVYIDADAFFKKSGNPLADRVLMKERH